MEELPSETGADIVPRQQPRTGRLHRTLFWRVAQILFGLFCRSWLRLAVSGREHIDDARGGLLLVNHQSFLDPMLVAVLLNRPVAYVARDSLFRVPVIGAILRITHVIPISREAVRGGSIRTALERLDEGFLVGIFPEGTRSSGDTVHHFRAGFLALARRSTQPIYPVGIAGADRALPRSAWFIRPVRIRIVYGPAFNADVVSRFRDDPDNEALAEFAREQVAECQRAAAALLK